VDERAYQEGVAAALKNGVMTYQELIGPNWREKFAELAAELEVARELGIPLAALEMKSGGLASATRQEGQDNG